MKLRSTRTLLAIGLTAVVGGAVVEPKMAVGTMGFAAYFRDTEGIVVGLWENAS